MRRKKKRAAPLLAASVLRSQEEVRSAERAFRKLAPVAQFDACREIAETRGAELVLAYRNLVSVGFGYKTRKRPRGSGEDVEFRYPCVVLVVSRKWRSIGRTGDPQRLPAHLFTYQTVDGERVLCAVPTDVKMLSTFGARSRPHSDLDLKFPFGIAVETGDLRSRGTMARAIERKSALFALSCRHVLTMSIDGVEKASGCSVRPVGVNGKLGTTENVRGRLVPETEGASLDAQLVRVSDRAALRRALFDLRFDTASPAASGPVDIPAHFLIATPRRDEDGNRLKIRVEARDFVSKSLPYEDEGFDAVHDFILHAVADGTLEPGDSGSPAVPVHAGKTFLGMYIGGDGTNAYIIPAWQLVRAANYGLPGEKQWTVTNA